MRRLCNLYPTCPRVYHAALKVLSAAARGVLNRQALSQKMTKFPKNSILKKLAYPLYLFFLIVLGYAATITYRSNELYTYVKSSSNELLTSGVLEYHSVLGYSPRPGSSGEMQFLLPPNIPVNYDHQMFRVVPGYTAAADSPLLLFLGCSWTHGDATRAEDTFAHLVGTGMNARYRNAGYHAYGLSQMLLRAREVIPRDKPDYVLVQYSPWLVSRSMRHFAGGHFLQRPVPYFVRDQDGHLGLASPAFNGDHGQPIGDYRGYGPSFTDFTSFTLKAALPFYLHQDLNGLGYQIRSAFGRIPEAHDGRLDIVSYAYGEIESLCRINGCRMLIYRLERPSGTPEKPSWNHRFVKEETRYLKGLAGVTYVDSYSAVLEALKTSDESTYLKEYAHYRGNPPKLVDRHPNPRAHAIIARSIIEALKE